MSHTTDSARLASVEAGAGRPFRFSLVLEEGRGWLRAWLGGKWAFLLGAAVVALFAAAGAVAALASDRTRGLPGAFSAAGAAMGAAAVAVHLRTRRYLFERREGTWWWREAWNPVRGRWAAITEEDPLRMEREILSTVEGFTLHAGRVRLLSYLGDPSIGRSVGVAFQSAGIPLRTVVKRPQDS